MGMGQMGHGGERPHGGRAASRRTGAVQYPIVELGGLGRSHEFERILARTARLAVLVLFCLGTGLSAIRAQAETAQNGLTTERLQLITAERAVTILVELADTPRKQALGLMFRTSLADDQGMLFVHERPGELTMWMRNTYIPLDMVFIRADGIIHRIEEMTEPHSEEVIASRGDVTAVLELAGGASRRYGLKAGDRVVHRHFAAPTR